MSRDQIFSFFATTLFFRVENKLHKGLCHEYDLMFNLYIRIRDLAKASDDPDAKMTAQVYEQFIPIVDNMRNEAYALLDELAED